MRKLTTLLLLIFTTIAFSQEVEVIKQKIKVNDGIQKGKLVYNGTKHVPDGIWKSEFGKAEYNMGTLVWIEPIKGERYTYNQIRMEQLRRKVQRLETRLASNNK